MADNKSTSATNKLGQLYVEFGTKGLGGVLTGLNGVSAGFLNNAALAQKAVKAVHAFYKTVGTDAVNLHKASVLTGMSDAQTEYLNKWAKLNEVNFDTFINNIIKIQQAVKQVGMGEGSPISIGLNLGMNPSDYDIEKKPLEFFNDLQRKIKTLYEKSPSTALYALGKLQMDGEMLQIMVNANKELDLSLRLGEDRLELYREEKKDLNEMAIAWETIVQKAMGLKDVRLITKDIVKFLKWVNQWQDEHYNKNGVGVYEAWRSFLGDTQFRTETLKNMKSALPKASQRNMALQEDVQRQNIYNITNNNQVNKIEDFKLINYETERQAQLNNIHNSSNGGRKNAK